MLNQIKSVVYDFSLFPRFVSFEFVGKSVSFGAVFWTSILLRWKFSENCLNQFSRKREARAVGSIRTLNLVF